MPMYINTTTINSKTEISPLLYKTELNFFFEKKLRFLRISSACDRISVSYSDCLNRTNASENVSKEDVPYMLY